MNNLITQTQNAVQFLQEFGSIQQIKVTEFSFEVKMINVDLKDQLRSFLGKLAQKTANYPTIRNIEWTEDGQFSIHLVNTQSDESN